MPINPTPYRVEKVVFPTPNVSDILFYETEDAERVGYLVPEYGTFHPDTKNWPNHRLVFIESADDEGRFYRYYYASDQLDQDDDNWAFSQADIGGTRFDAVTRQYVIRRDQFDPDSPAMGSAMPDNPAGKFTGTYVLAERQQQNTNDKTINSLYVIEQRTYVKKVPFYEVNYDEVFRTSNFSSQTLYYLGEIPDGQTDPIEVLIDNPSSSYWGMDNGVVRSGKQLTANWFVVSEQQVVKTSEGSATYSYNHTVNYSFPPILASIAIETWNRRDGGADTHPRPIYSSYGYNGPCKAETTVVWTVAKPSLTAVSTPPKPLPIVISTPVFGVSIPATLHGVINVPISTGTNHPVYDYTAGTYSFPATNYPTAWPASLTVSCDIKPFRGGWLKETVVVYSPPA